MFNTQKMLLKQLKNIQSQIKSCKETIALLEPPAPESLNDQKNMICWLRELSQGNNPTVERASDGLILAHQYYSLDYLTKLGNYFINIAKYEKEKYVCSALLKQFLEQERYLKNQLGID
jgi:hypothetical protein